MTQSKIYLALYRGRRDGTGWRVWAARFTDWLTRKVTRGQYSHAEIAVALGDGQFECYSSSIRDGGVRRKIMPLPGAKWDLIEIGNSPALHSHLLLIWELAKGRPYDWPGALGFLFFTRPYGDRWFCSEFCAEVIDLNQPWRFSPNSLAAVVRSKLLR